MRISDWSSDVCSSDLGEIIACRIDALTARSEEIFVLIGRIGNHREQRDRRRRPQPSPREDRQPQPRGQRAALERKQPREAPPRRPGLRDRHPPPPSGTTLPFFPYAPPPPPLPTPHPPHQPP